MTENYDLYYGEKGPTVRQKQFRDAPQLNKLYGGAVGGGKSWCISSEGTRLSMLYPGNRGFMCRQEAKAFKETTLVTLLALISKIERMSGTKIMANHRKADQTIEFVNGSTILYGGIGGSENKDRVKSMELGWAAVDEASECAEDDINMLESRLRWQLPDGTYPIFHCFYASNPEPGWLKRRFVDPHFAGRLPDDLAFIQALPRDNNWLPDGYVDRISAGKPDYWVKRYIDGSWDAAEGQVWPQFDRNIHVFPNENCDYEIRAPLRKEQYKYIFSSLDHGQANPACFLGWYVDKDSNLFVYDMYYDSGLISKHVREIKEKFKMELFHYNRTDPSVWNTVGEREGKEWTTADEYHEHGLRGLAKANNTLRAGLNRVGEFLYNDPAHIHPILGTTGSPRVFISARCEKLVEEILGYIWKPQRRPDVNDAREEPLGRRDHSVDAFRYGIMSRPSIAAKKKVIPINCFDSLKRSSIAYEQNSRLREMRGVAR